MLRHQGFTSRMYSPLSTISSILQGDQLYMVVTFYKVWEHTAMFIIKQKKNILYIIIYFQINRND